MKQENGRSVAERLIEPYTRGFKTTTYYIKSVMAENLGEYARRMLQKEHGRVYARMHELRRKGALHSTTGAAALKRCMDEYSILGRALEAREELIDEQRQEEVARNERAHGKR